MVDSQVGSDTFSETDSAPFIVPKQDTPYLISILIIARVQYRMFDGILRETLNSPM